MITGESLGIAIGVVGLVGTVIAAVDARRSARRVERLVTAGQEAATDARAAAEESKQAAEEVKVAVEQVRLLADDLAASSRVERLEKVRELVRYIATRASLAEESGVAASDELVEPLGWFDVTRLTETLGRLLIRSGRLHLPRCWDLFNVMRGLVQTLDSTPTAIDPEARGFASQEEIAALIEAADSAFREADRPVDQIPLGRPPA